MVPKDTSEVAQCVNHYLLIRHELAVISGIAMKGIIIIIPFLLQRQILEQLHSNCMALKE